MPDALITPAYRVPLMSGSDTARDWWLFWDRLSTQTNSNAKLAVQGLHGDRPDPEGMPDGAIYVEADRGVIYQNQDGVWTYIAGTMYGTINPDLRPVDLGDFDAGLPYRTTDEDRHLRGREFVWSGADWIEITPVMYGLHASRPLPAAAPARALYAETDRSSVLYQSQVGGIWEFIAGTMWGTLVPDQRPTDLGSHDAGFTFRTTVDPPREFIWSGTAWVETTASTGVLVHAICTSNLTITTVGQDIPGLLLTLPKPGKYHVTGVFDLLVLSGDEGNYLFGRLMDVTSAIAPQIAVLFGTAPNMRVTVAQQWSVTATAAGQTIKAQALKSGGTGGSLATTDGSSLAAVWVSP